MPPRATELWRDLLAVEKRGGQIRTETQAGNIPAESRMLSGTNGRLPPWKYLSPTV